jgi:serine O-acetyltransferase
MPLPTAPLAPDDEADLVDRLVASYESGPRTMHHLGAYELPQVAEVARCLEDIRALIFPGFVGGAMVGARPAELRSYIAERLDDLGRRLRRQVYRGLHHRCQLTSGRLAEAERGAVAEGPRPARDEPVGVRQGAPPERAAVDKRSPEQDCARCAETADGVVRRFLAALPELRATLATDVDAAYEGDPAATGTDEIIFCYPGLYAITAYRMANRLLAEGASIIPRMLTEHAHERTGIDIHPGATIGRSLFIDHGTGIVVGETTRIGERVRIYQGVTLGALSVAKGRRAEGKKRHPTIEDEVIIYANATILGGDTVIGRGAIIGGNCWVTRSVPAGARITVDGMTVGPV